MQRKSIFTTVLLEKLIANIDDNKGILDIEGLPENPESTYCDSIDGLEKLFGPYLKDFSACKSVLLKNIEDSSELSIVLKYLALNQNIKQLIFNRVSFPAELILGDALVMITILEQFVTQQEEEATSIIQLSSAIEEKTGILKVQMIRADKRLEENLQLALPADVAFSNSDQFVAESKMTKLSMSL